MSFFPLFRCPTLSLLLTCWACGGKSSVDASEHTPSVGGSGAQGGTGNAAGVGQSGGAGAVTGRCPSNRPVVGTACNYVGDPCEYAVDACNSAFLECVDGTWSSAAVNTGTGSKCSVFSAGQGGLPNDGDSCVCWGLLDCTVDDCSAEGKVHAVCDGTTWRVSREPCSNVPCGTDGALCKAGEVCVLSGGLGAKPTCQRDPCAEQSETTSCQCAGMLCGSPDLCSMESGVLLCSCPTCVTY